MANGWITLSEEDEEECCAQRFAYEERSIHSQITSDVRSWKYIPSAMEKKNLSNILRRKVTGSVS